MHRILLILLLALPVNLFAQSDSAAFDHLPFAMYDTDTGFGAGYKAVLRNALGTRESFDLTLFASTKGERWVRIGWSLPDAELRQRTVYPVAIDVVLDYDKMIMHSFFGVGSGSRFDDREFYSFEPLELTTAFSRGFSPSMVARLQLRFKRVWSYSFETLSRLREHPDNAATADLWSIGVQLRYDTRNSVIHPTSGHVLQGEMEQALDLSPAAYEWTRIAAWAQYYTSFGDLTLALRTGLQSMSGEVPIQHMLPIGGNSTVRGIPGDRYLDRNSAVANAELRFPLFRCLAAVAGMDAGAVAPGVGSLSDARWIVTPVVGLRLIFDTFVTRADLGYSGDAIGFYLNFGHIF
ncbi:MAG: BamA/TamA family outer membrane protein [Bacteroidetes bacterium]|nr:BamA/TamA family outer membrane protein [Bacteroidota bacterium]